MGVRGEGSGGKGGGKGEGSGGKGGGVKWGMPTPMSTLSVIIMPFCF